MARGFFSWMWAPAGDFERRCEAQLRLCCSSETPPVGALGGLGALGVPAKGTELRLLFHISLTSAKEGRSSAASLHKLRCFLSCASFF